MSNVSAIYRAIIEYGGCYAALQRWQERSPLIPLGDQKTGCIGEFYVYLYLRAKFPDATLTYAGHSQKGWDIEVSRPERRWRVQVKTVSEYSTTRTISPIHRGWDRLLVVYLDRDFKPRGFWVITDTSIVAPGKALTSRKCPYPDGRRSGSKGIPWGENQVDEFMKLVGPQIQVGD